MVAAAVVLPTVPADAQARELFTIDDQRIDEASGLAVGQRSPGVLYVQNDSGDSSRFFALDARTGRTAATVEVAGARNDDWEDLAVAKDRSGTPSVWLADIGDNDAQRKDIRVYRVDEPRIAASDRDRRTTTEDADVWRLRYPDGASDAESLAVTPDGVAYLVTKSFLGGSTVYRLPPTPDGKRVQTLQRVADIRFSLTGTPGGPDPIGQLTATGASFGRDGTVFAVRTYTDAYLWSVADGDLAGALALRPVRVALPEQPQGEGIAVDGRRLLVDSEGVGEPVYAVPLPKLPTAPAATSQPSAPTPEASTAAPEPAASDGTFSNYAFWALLIGAIVLVLGFGVVVVLVGGAETLVRHLRRRR